jgi:thiosulfate/3-mercaptopyruvate sulfurtransferase
MRRAIDLRTPEYRNAFDIHSHFTIIQFSMKALLVSLMICALVAGPASSRVMPESGGGLHVLITPSQLEEMMNDPATVILMVAQSKREYAKGHIPGSRFLWPGWLSASNPDLSTQVLPVGQLDTLLGGLGISLTSRVVLCGSGGNVSSTARAYAIFDYLGMGGRTFVLNGGVEAWQGEGHALSTELPLIVRGAFTPKVNPDAIADIDLVAARLHSAGTSIIDARSPQAYNAKPSVGTRGGHIPGAKNISSSVVVDSTSRFVSADSLRTLFTRAGVASGDEVITYCVVGQSASVLYLAAKELGYRVRLYDGSFEDWNSRDDLPVELPPPPAPK